MKIKANEIFKLKDLNNKWKWIAKDGDGTICLYTIKPRKSDYCWYYDDECFNITNLFNGSDIDFGTDDWNNCIAEIPVNYTDYIGKLGIFSDSEEELNLKSKNIYILYSINDGTSYKFIDITGTGWKFFRPLTKEEIEELTNYGE